MPPLLASGATRAATTQSTRRWLGRSTTSTTTLRAGGGAGLGERLFREFYHLTLLALDIPDDDNTRAASMQEFFAANPVPPLFDDVPPVLAQLRDAGHTLGIITQRGREGAERFLAEHEIADYFAVLVAGDDGHGRKPTPGPFQQALAALDRDGARTIYVGDRIDDDCEGACGAGLGRAFLIDREGVYMLEARGPGRLHPPDGHASIA
ncbi:MAG: HAD-IA family hydrolase [Caldilineaceae bacterium]